MQRLEAGQQEEGEERLHHLRPGGGEEGQDGGGGAQVRAQEEKLQEGEAVDGCEGGEVNKGDNKEGGVPGEGDGDEEQERGGHRGEAGGGAGPRVIEHVVVS